MTLNSQYKTKFSKKSNGNQVDIDPNLGGDHQHFCPMVSVVEITNGKNLKRVVTVRPNFAFSAEQARKLGLVIEAAGRLCAMAEDYGSLQRAWFYSFCKPQLVAVNNASTAIH